MAASCSEVRDEFEMPGTTYMQNFEIRKSDVCRKRHRA